MKYNKLYNQLIEGRLNNKPNGYCELHHIKPKSIGGSDVSSNLVYLTAREHYIAHLILHRIHRRSETAFALWMMQCKSDTNEGRPHIKNSRMYEWARKEFKKYISDVGKTWIGEKNSQYGTMWISNIELKENKKIKKTDFIPDGWVKGRNKWNVKPIREKLKSPIHITDGEKNQMLYYKDQIVPDGWYRGMTQKPLSDEAREKLSKRISQSNINRRGIKYKK